MPILYPTLQEFRNALHEHVRNGNRLIYPLWADTKKGDNVTFLCATGLQLREPATAIRKATKAEYLKEMRPFCDRLGVLLREYPKMRDENGNRVSFWQIGLHSNPQSANAENEQPVPEHPEERQHKS